jgi:hypothetical protein
MADANRPKKALFRRPLETNDSAHEGSFSHASALTNIPVNARGEKGVDPTAVGDQLPKYDLDWREQPPVGIAAQSCRARQYPCSA